MKNIDMAEDNEQSTAYGGQSEIQQDGLDYSPLKTSFEGVNKSQEVYDIKLSTMMKQDSSNLKSSEGRTGIMSVKKTDALKQIKQRCISRLNQERQNLIKQRRQMKGLGQSYLNQIS